MKRTRRVSVCDTRALYAVPAVRVSGRVGYVRMLKGAFRYRVAV
jgi:hypothetical protein